MVGEAGYMWGQAMYRKSLMSSAQFYCESKNKLKEKGEKCSRRRKEGKRGKAKSW